MQFRNKLDAPNRFVRAQRRWVRGATVIVLVGLFAVLAYIFYGFTEMLAVEVLGLSPFIGQAIGFAVAATVIPWMIGDRGSIRIIGRLADSDDNAD